MGEAIERYGGQSAVAPLRDVLVHRPGPSFGAAFEDPALGFRHPVDLAAAQREHDALTDLLTRLGVRVHQRRRRTDLHDPRHLARDLRTAEESLRGGVHMLREFRDFVLRGNVIDLAVGIVIGAAFTALVTSFTGDVLTPLLGLVGVPDFSAAASKVGEAEVRYGLFLNAAISFVLVAAALFFGVVKPVNALERRRQAAAPAGPTTKTCPECASEIPLAARRCPMCTSQLAAE